MVNRMSTSFAGSDVIPAPILPNTKTVKQNETSIVVGGEIAAPEPFSLRSVTNTHPEQGLTIAGVNDILLAAEAGSLSEFVDLADSMETKDQQYRTVLTSRKMAVAGLKVIVESASDSPEDSAAADLVRRVLAGDWLADQMMNIMDAIGKGFSVLEIIWDYSNDGYLIPVDLKYRTQKFFTFQHPDGFIHDGTKLFLRQPTASFGGQPLDTWPNNFLIHFPKQRSGLPIMAGTAYASAYVYQLKQMLLKNWLKYAEVYAMPPRMGEYPKGTPKAKQDEFLASLHAMGSDATMIYESGMKVAFAELKGQLGGGGGEKIYHTLVQYLDDAVTKLCLGQTLTTDNAGGRGSYALGAVHHAVRIDLLKADAKQLANTLNRYLSKPMVDFNFGKQARYPVIRFNVQENIDLTVAQANIQAGVALGVPIGVDHFRSIFSLPVPRVDEALLSLPVAPIASAAGVEGGTEAPKPAGGLGGSAPKPEGGAKAPAAAQEPTKKPSVATKPDGKSSPGDAAKKENNVPLGEITDLPSKFSVRMTLSQLRKSIFGKGESNE
jgi:phage gp29-like protein